MTLQSVWNGGRRSRSRRASLQVEQLESRLVPYTTTGNAWPSPQLVTVSFVPDGTILGSNGSNYLTSNMFSVWNAHFGSASVWQNQILKALEAWGQQTNLNFAVVADNGSTIGSGSYQQGDPGMGDIRIGGYNFGSTWLAQAEMPPPINNYSIAGDIQFNTAQPFNVGTTYDLFTVAMHEVGHALGLGHSTVSSNPTPVMNAAYTSVHTGLTADDIAGIRAIYSNGNPRSPDAYYGGPIPNNSFLTAAVLTPLLNPLSLTGQLTNLDITTPSETEYYAVAAPLGTSGTLTMQVQSSGLSLLAPKVTVYAADEVTVLGSATATGTEGATLTVTVNGVTPLQLLYIKVSGNQSVTTGPGTHTSNLFDTGAYALTLNFGTGASPAVPLPNTTKANGNPLSAGGGLPQLPSPGNGDAAGSDTFDPNGDGPPAVPAPAETPAVAAVAAAGAVAPAPTAPAARPAAREFAAVLPPTPAGQAPVLAPAAPAPAGAPVPAPVGTPPERPAQAADVESGGGAAADQGDLDTSDTPTAPADPGAETQPPSPDLTPDITPALDVMPADQFWVSAGSDGASALGDMGDPGFAQQGTASADRALNPGAAAGCLALLLAWGTEPEKPRQHRRHT